MNTATFFTFRFKRGTAAGWLASNPILQPGEPGFETDTNKLKIGDGIRTWTALPYIAGVGGGSGTPGPPGADGLDGVNGTNGTNGASAYALAVAGGYSGTQAQWIASMDPSSLANSPAAIILGVTKTGGIWPSRPTSRSDITVLWFGADPPPAIVSSGTTGMLDGKDYNVVIP